MTRSREGGGCKWLKGSGPPGKKSKSQKLPVLDFTIIFYRTNAKYLVTVIVFSTLEFSLLKKKKVSKEKKKNRNVLHLSHSFSTTFLRTWDLVSFSFSKFLSFFLSLIVAVRVVRLVSECPRVSEFVWKRYSRLLLRRYISFYDSASLRANCCVLEIA